MTIEKTIGMILARKRQTVCVAESCSGGLLGHRLTNIAGSSEYFNGGVIVYSNAAKTKLLNISPALLKKYGAVSAPVAEKMAKNVRKILRTNFGISITGIAGPSGGTKEKPVGLTFIAVANAKRVVCKEFHFKGSRLSIKTCATETALKLLYEIIS